MWRHRLGFGALCLVTATVAVWVLVLLQSHTADPVTSGPTDSESRAQGEPSKPTPHDSSAADDEAGRQEPDSREAPPDDVPRDVEAVRVLKHTDGDTLHVAVLSGDGRIPRSQDTTVRLLEIDTPESVDPSSPEECYSQKATKRLSELLPVGSRAWALPDRELLDFYDRTLLYMWNEDGVFVNLAMVEEGVARAVLYQPNDLYMDEMRAAELRAQERGNGLWGACDFFGEPKGLLASPEDSTPTSAAPAPGGTDPRFSYCYEANDAGLGNYVSGRDPEYDWYDDTDGDGRVCEF